MIHTASSPRARKRQATIPDNAVIVMNPSLAPWLPRASTRMPLTAFRATCQKGEHVSCQRLDLVGARRFGARACVHRIGAERPGPRGGYGPSGVKGARSGRREGQGELRRLGRRGRVGRSGRAQRAGAGGGGGLTGGDFDPGRASAYICHAMALYRPQRSSPTV